MQIQDILKASDLKINQQAVSDLDKSNFKRDLRHLLSYFFASAPNELFLKNTEQLTKEKTLYFVKCFADLLKGKPLAYILKQQAFYKSIFFVDDRVLIPRMDSEVLIEAVLKLFANHKNLIFADFGTGSGCLALSLLKELKNSKSFAIDKSEQALQVAKHNAKTLCLKSQISFACLDTQDCFSSKSLTEFKSKQHFTYFDFIVANPPYILKTDYIHHFVKKYEPHLALQAGDRGLDILLDWAKIALQLLKPAAYYVFEFGDGQKEYLNSQLKTLFSDVYFLKDLQGIYRVAVCKK